MKVKLIVSYISINKGWSIVGFGTGNSEGSHNDYRPEPTLTIVVTEEEAREYRAGQEVIIEITKL